MLREIIVSDGGSRDETGRIAAQQGVQVVTGARGRGPQMNAAAGVACGDVVWFLHADARPHPLALRDIARAYNGGCEGGNFRLKFRARGAWPRGFELIARVQRACGVAYGDAGLWARRDVFLRLGGFPAWPLFEDYDLWRRLRAGGRLHYSRLPIWVAARRFHGSPGRVLCLWARLQLEFWRGASPHDLARRYHS